MLAAPATAVFGHPYNPDNTEYPCIQYGLQFEDRKGVQPVEVTRALLIGEEEIVDYYEEFVGASNNTIRPNDRYVPKDVLVTAATVEKLNLTESKSRFEKVRDQLVMLTHRLVLPERVWHAPLDSYSEGWNYLSIVELLPAMHILDPSGTDEVIRQFATYGGFLSKEYESVLVDALAAIRSPKALDSLSPDEQQMWKHLAGAEVYQMRIDA